MDEIMDAHSKAEPDVLNKPEWDIDGQLASLRTKLALIASGSGAVISPDDANLILRFLPTPITDEVKAGIASLTRREVQVMEMLARGVGNHDIAKQLEISVKTVDTHRGHIMRKLGLKGNPALTRFAIRYGYVTL